MKTLKTIAIVFSLATIFTSCSNDSDATPVNEEELITTITAVFTPEGGGTAITLESKDLDGEGPDAPAITISAPFAQNTTYNGVVTFENESVNPAEDITEEILAEAEDHQIFYQKTGTLNGFSYSTNADNFDANGKPVGGYHPEHALTAAQALNGMTIWNAIASFTENDLGTLEAGKKADFVVLDRDLLKVDLQHAMKVRVKATFVGGEKVF